MNKLDNLIVKAKIKKNVAMEKTAAFFASKEHGDETLLVKIMLMVIAVVIVIIFRDTLKNIITELLNQVKTKIQGMYDSTIVP